MTRPKGLILYDIRYKYVSRKYQNFFFFFNRSLFLNSFILQSVCTRTRGIKLYPVNHWTALSNSIWAPLSLVNPCSIPLSRFQPFFRHICFFHSSFLPFYLSTYFHCFLLSCRKVLATNWPIQWILLNVPYDLHWSNFYLLLSIFFISLFLSLALSFTLSFSLSFDIIVIKINEKITRKIQNLIQFNFDMFD